RLEHRRCHDHSGCRQCGIVDIHLVTRRQQLSVLRRQLARWPVRCLLSALRAESHHPALSCVRNGARDQLEILHHVRSRYRDVVMRLVAAGGVLLSMAVAGCHGETKGGSVPVDTAAAMPLAGTANAESTATTAPPVPLESASVAPAAPVVIQPADSAAGYALYHGRGRCFTCHGGLGRGTAKLGPDLTDTTWLNGDSSFTGIRGVIASGVATPRQFSVAMPAYAGMLDDSDL